MDKRTWLILIVCPCLVACDNRPVAHPNGILFVDPPDVQFCTGMIYVTANVSWAVQDPAVKTVRVEAQAPNSAVRTVFVKGSANGEVKTGEWTTKGTMFFLFDDDSNRELASFRVGNKHCDESNGP